MIEINQLKVTRKGQPICLVDHLSVSQGQKVGIIGPNGSGKTTLLKVLAGLITDFSGTCRVDTESHETTFIHQQPYLFRGSVQKNLTYGQLNRAGELPSMNDLLVHLGIEYLANRDVKNLSAGEIRRVALARALACKPRLLILDEPLADLDPQATTAVCDLLNGLSNTTIIIASPFDLPTELQHRKFELISPNKRAVK